MAQPEHQEKPQPDVLRRQELELEQARVALEDAHAEIAALADENSALRHRLELVEAARNEAEKVARCARDDAARSMGLITRSLSTTTDEKGARVALEEASVLAEELRATNEALVQANDELEQRVADRTLALDQANTKLERLNAHLRVRIEAETAARGKAQAELFQMQKLEAIGQLTGGIAHDFNNLLTVITSGLQLLARPRDAAHHDRLLGRIQDAAWRGAQLTQRLLAFARRQPLHPERLDLQQHMESMRSLLAHALREDIEMILEVGPDVWPVEADIAALELALLNLAVNARDAMPAGGRLVLAACNEPTPNGSGGRLDLAPGDYVRLSLSDNGIGMAPEVLDKVFEPFFSTKGDGKGTGLGLAQVYGFARQSGGGAVVESASGKGSTVHILLPRSHRPPVAVPSLVAAETSEPHQYDHLKILVVEDDDSVASMVLDMLAELGHSGMRVATVASALALLMSTYDFDLVFSDVLLPGGGSGLDLAREMSRRGLAVPLILTSGFGGGVTQRLAAANLPFLRKPYRIEALNQTIGAAMQSARRSVAGAV
ncbi:MAG TPA: ATP-binding protein [Acetobacteraceae bacterium]|nr:ATP-binding protein [Acetobacteraceae bacterium]